MNNRAWQLQDLLHRAPTTGWAPDPARLLSPRAPCCCSVAGGREKEKAVQNPHETIIASSEFGRTAASRVQYSTVRHTERRRRESREGGGGRRARGLTAVVCCGATMNSASLDIGVHGSDGNSSSCEFHSHIDGNSSHHQLRREKQMPQLALIISGTMRRTGPLNGTNGTYWDHWPMMAKHVVEVLSAEAEVHSFLCINLEDELPSSEVMNGLRVLMVTRNNTAQQQTLGLRACRSIDMSVQRPKEAVGDAALSTHAITSAIPALISRGLFACDPTCFGLATSRRCPRTANATFRFARALCMADTA